MTALVHGIDPQRVEAAVFDLGGVFLAGGPQAVVAFGARHGVRREVWDTMRDELFRDDGLWSAVERGEASFVAFIERLRALLAAEGVTISTEEAESFMGSMGSSAAERLRHEIVDAAARLHRCMPTALLTNNIREWRDGWRSLLDIDALFDLVIDSSEVGMRKPETGIYELTQARLGLPHEALFFVDDIGGNLKAARFLGWQTLRYDDTARVLEVLHAIAAAKPPRRTG